MYRISPRFIIYSESSFCTFFFFCKLNSIVIHSVIFIDLYWLKHAIEWRMIYLKGFAITCLYSAPCLYDQRNKSSRIYQRLIRISNREFPSIFDRSIANKGSVREAASANCANLNFETGMLSSIANIIVIGAIIFVKFC